MMYDSLQSPFALCDRLGLVPDERQEDIMRQFMEGGTPLDYCHDDDGHTLRAVAVCALWQLLRRPGSQLVIVAPHRRFAEPIFSFLREVTTQIDPVLTAVCRWRRPTAMQIGSSRSYGIKLVVDSRPECMHGMHQDTTFLMLDAGADRAGDMDQAIMQASHGTDSRTVRLW